MYRGLLNIKLNCDIDISDKLSYVESFIKELRVFNSCIRVCDSSTYKSFTLAGIRFESSKEFASKLSELLDGFIYEIIEASMLGKVCCITLSVYDDCSKTIEVYKFDVDTDSFKSISKSVNKASLFTSLLNIKSSIESGDTMQKSLLNVHTSSRSICKYLLLGVETSSVSEVVDSYLNYTN